MCVFAVCAHYTCHIGSNEMKAQAEERKGDDDGTKKQKINKEKKGRKKKRRKVSIYLSSMIVIDSIACSSANLKGTTPRFVFELNTYIVRI